MSEVHIDGRTKVPLFAVGAAVPFLFGTVLWLTSVDTKATQCRDELQNQKTEIKGLRSLLQETRDAVMEIRGKLFYGKRN